MRRRPLPRGRQFQPEPGRSCLVPSASRRLLQNRQPECCGRRGSRLSSAGVPDGDAVARRRACRGGGGASAPRGTGPTSPPAYGVARSSSGRQRLVAGKPYSAGTLHGRRWRDPPAGTMGTPMAGGDGRHRLRPRAFGRPLAERRSASWRSRPPPWRRRPRAPSSMSWPRISSRAPSRGGAESPSCPTSSTALASRARGMNSACRAARWPWRSPPSMSGSRSGGLPPSR